MVETSQWEKYTEKADFKFHKSLHNKTHSSLYNVCSYLGNGTFTSARQFSLLVDVQVSADWFLSLTLKTLKLCAVAEGIRHDNIFIEVI